VADTPRSTGFSLRRWSQRKLAAGRDERDVAVMPDSTPKARVTAPPPPETTCPPSVSADVATAAAAKAPDRSTAPATTQPTAALPPIESLTVDSDFSPFMQRGVDENVKRMALRKLLRDPRFNVMDGLDVYIDDYSKPSPIDPALVRTLVQARYIFDPPKTRVTREGTVENVPDEAVEAAADAAPEAEGAPAVTVANAADGTVTQAAPGSSTPPAMDSSATRPAPTSAMPASADPADAA
jgi:uncharacterized protein DUF3306